MAPSKAAAAAAASLFAKDEKVLCFHHDMLYEAKILDVRKTDEKDGERASWQYKIHYKGWKNTCWGSLADNSVYWDDWVLQDRIRKFTDENKEMAASMHNQMKQLRNPAPKTAAAKRGGGRANGSDFSSARGSEERHASVATQGVRGGARRHRDYDLETQRTTMSSSSLGDLDYDSDTTVSEDWESIYHPYDCERGYHDNPTLSSSLFGLYGMIIKSEQASFSLEDDISKIAWGRKRVREDAMEPASAKRTPASPSMKIAEKQMQDCANLSAMRLASSISGGGVATRFWWDRGACPKTTSTTQTRAQKPRHGFFLPPSSSTASVLLNFLAAEAVPKQTAAHTVTTPNFDFADMLRRMVRLVVSPKGYRGNTTAPTPAKSPEVPGTLRRCSARVRGAQALASKYTTRSAQVAPTPQTMSKSTPHTYPDMPVATSAPPPPRILLRTNTPPEVKAKLAAALMRRKLLGPLETPAPQRKASHDIAKLVDMKDTTATQFAVRTVKRRRVSRDSTKASGLDSAIFTPSMAYSSKRKASNFEVHNNQSDHTTTSKMPQSKKPRLFEPEPEPEPDTKIEVEDEDQTEDEYRFEDEDQIENEVDEVVEPVLATGGTRSSRAARRSGAEGSDFVFAELVPSGKSRRKPLMSWSDPKSKDWDPIRVLNDDSLLAPDSLLRLPPKNFTYIDNNGKLREPPKYHAPKPKPATAAPHPQLQYHTKNGTASNRRHYEGRKRHHVLPTVGGIDIPETGSGWKPGGLFRGRRAQHMKALTANAEAGVDTRAPVVQETDDDSSFLSLPPSSTPPYSSDDKALIPNLLPETVPSFAKRYQGFMKHIARNVLTIHKIDQEENFQARPTVQLSIPDHIKAILVDDWENVTKNQQLVPIPAQVSVNEILDDYAEYESARRQEGTVQGDLLPEVVSGMKQYFRQSLSRILLYRFERIQYTEIRESFVPKDGDSAGRDVGDVYGAEHLCRLIVALPELIAQTNMDAQSVNRLREELTKLIIWLGKNIPKYFVKEYETPGSEYVEKARLV
ncbi:uncharacterized protein L3040_000564 [Drepanopeziza brunnea f. sp. 'multigermtubi']|uniref:uncharacterized protein n=1 Tax=Drepanopeziza brunnea f. sp. 'multigermtubi' TaxID=698441 RepID=UPI00238EF8C0|nr:hypothetical protein L3040_000564 [Drepanopeziza brunnea f. sp. 'multigermtubi']